MSVLLGGFAASQMLYVAARLNLADHLAAGPMDAQRLAEETGSRVDPLRRIVTALAAFGVFEVLEDGLIANTPLSECLRAEAPGSLRDLALLYGEEHYHAMSELLQAVKRGGTAFEHAYGKPHFTYLASNRDAAQAYYGASGAAAENSAAGVVATYEFRDASTVVDVGGGDGRLLRAVLAANPTLSGILVDSSGHARRASARIRAAGLADRCEVQTSDIFESVTHGGDVYLLGHIVHALDDDRAVCVLTSCRRAMKPESRLLLIERLLPERPETNLSAQRTSVSDAIALAVSGGRERTLHEHEALLGTALLKVHQTIATGTGDTIIEAVVRG
jgi:SAM-dependent methyltransferase